MSENQFVRKLRREITRNPKKAAILGLLAVVALYFWAPLVRSWIAPAAASGTPPPDALTAASEASSAGGVGAGAMGASAVCQHPWEQLVQWRKNDPLSVSANSLAGRRDPFRSVGPKVSKAEVQEKERDALRAATTPQSLGLKLSSTVVGASRRTALINGRSYLEGQTIKCGKDGMEVAFLLVEVRPRQVVLEREGKSYDLAIPQKKAIDRIELSGSPK